MAQNRDKKLIQTHHLIQNKDGYIVQGGMDDFFNKGCSLSGIFICNINLDSYFHFLNKTNAVNCIIKVKG